MSRVAKTFFESLVEFSIQAPIEDLTRAEQVLKTARATREKSGSTPKPSPAPAKRGRPSPAPVTSLAEASKE